MGEGRILRRLKSISQQVNAIEDDYAESAMSDDELRGQTADLRQRLDNGESLESLLPEAFATVREATKRVLGKRHYDVQIMGGAALHLGNIAEMKTGEGKTQVALLPSYLNALGGKGVHVVTVNDYLAEFQSEQMGRVHHFLGLEVGAILASMSPAERRKAYAADVTYGTNNEFGFDYLRDNMALSVDDLVQRGHNFAIVDEVDSILIDEARTPLIISGPAEDNNKWYPEFAKLVTRLKRDRHYEVDEKKRTVSINEDGIEVLEDRLGIDNLYESVNTPLISYLQNALKAKELFLADRDYVVIDGEVLIVDEHTGRSLQGRRYNEGLHQAIEAKEKVEIREEYQTLATITLQNFFRMYDKLSGMTGTAMTEASEFQKIYGLGVVPIPTNKPMIREDQKDLIFRTEQAKFEAIIEDVEARYADGQPVLIGTASVAKSEVLSKMLKQAGIKHEVLNAKQHEREAAIVAEAGRKSAVTVATNMAGRGTDIILGGNPEFMAEAQLRKEGVDPIENAEEYEERWDALLTKFEDQVQSEHEEVVEAGGLYVVGSERHESRRIDNQLRGRSGRQGDPGESRFYLSLEDKMMRVFNADAVEWVMQRMNVPDDVPIENRTVGRSIASAQAQMESQNFEQRKNVLKYDDVMNRQRHAIYGDRRQVLEGADVEEQLRSTVAKVVEQYVVAGTEGFAEEWDLAQLWTDMKTLYPVELDLDEYEKKQDTLEQEELIEAFIADSERAYDEREKSVGEETMREVERQVMLSVLDRKWREHLYEMDYLREGIGLRAMAQRDPLVEYQREGSVMFNSMMASFMEEVVGFLFNLDVQSEGPEVGVVTEGGKPVVITSGPDLDEDGVDVRVSGDVEDPEPTDPEATDPEPTDDAAEPAEEKAPAKKSTKKAAAKKAPAKKSAKPLSYSAPDEDGNASSTTSGADEAEDDWAKTPRNAPCPCGSGRKYKMCHGKS
ncbi:preprotein translocase subunit SecA [Propionibacteriaceae bacterium Y1700]|uniref:preprotein translocase subunit SecA n=1 Tax=Microlunatus sp. Y1700 TaxID=3418487 RepID=UPI003DA6D4DC